MESKLSEPRTIGQIFRTTFALYRRHFWYFFAIVAVVDVPLALFRAGSSAIRAREVGGRQTAGSVAGVANASHDSARPEAVDENGNVAREKKPIRWGELAVSLAALCPDIALKTLASGALMMSVSAICAGGRLTVGQAYGSIRRRLVSLGCAGVLVFSLVLLGIGMCIFPGVAFLLWFAFTIPCVVAEDLGVMRAMRRSKALAQQHMARMIGVVLVVTLIGLAIGILLPNSIRHVTESTLGANLPLVWFITGFVSSVLLMCLRPIGSLALILLYYSVRASGEQTTISQLADYVTLKYALPGSEQPG